MLKNKPQRAQRTAKKMLSILFHPKTQTFGALGGLGGSSYSWKLEFQQPAKGVVRSISILQVLFKGTSTAANNIDFATKSRRHQERLSVFLLLQEPL
jgi:hypothetical protein